ncbi:acyl-CoA N-acyltransferase [Limtongia smithiae]|uniref:acyl-CoA N-acyltransferase n=1 Tax=Limtongia smithiae TaxID=1125753 RepID=UPI0034CEA640
MFLEVEASTVAWDAQGHFKFLTCKPCCALCIIPLTHFALPTPSYTFSDLKRKMVATAETANYSIQLDDLTPNNLGVLRRINNVVLPAQYSDAWYKDSLNVGQLVKLAYFNDIPVGAIRCGLETPSLTKGSSNGTDSSAAVAKIYIMTFAVLAPYRGYGVGKKLIEHILEQAETMFVKEVYCHVWVENEDAMRWYENVAGFAKGEFVAGYYKRMTPPGDAYVFRKKIE